MHSFRLGYQLLTVDEKLSEVHSDYVAGAAREFCSSDMLCAIKSRFIPYK
jgi:hypothetical protein